jgi:hypothetical protein
MNAIPRDAAQRTIDLEPLLDVLAEKVAERLPQQERGRFANVTQLEPFVELDELSDFLGHAVKERWVRARVAEGMPHHLIGGKIRFRLSEALPWLERHGHVQRRGE